MPQRNHDTSTGSRPVLPWWQCIVLAGLAYLVLTYVIPALTLTGFVPKPPTAIAKAAALPVSLALLLAAPILYFRQRRRRQGTEKPRGLGSIRSLAQQEFERLLAGAFRQQGYVVEQRSGADLVDGIHLNLRQDGTVTLVQCKHWREQQVGIQPIRELFSAMTAEKATGALVITAGTFTAEAMAFAQSKPIGLIEGPALLELVQSVQAPQAKTQPAPDPAPKCHICSRPMVRRVARKGFRKGEAYWECAGYPHCKGTRLDQAA